MKTGFLLFFTMVFCRSSALAGPAPVLESMRQGIHLQAGQNRTNATDDDFLEQAETPAPAAREPDQCLIRAILEEDLGIRIGRIDAALRAVSANKDDAQDLGVDQGAPLLVRSHTLFREDGTVILYGEAFYVEPFSFRYTANVRRVHH